MNKVKYQYHVKATRLDENTGEPKIIWYQASDFRFENIKTSENLHLKGPEIAKEAAYRAAEKRGFKREDVQVYIHSNRPVHVIKQPEPASA